MIRVLCDVHRPMRFGKPGWVECTAPECQALMAKRRTEVEAAGGPTEEDKARWRGGLIGRATAKGEVR